MYSVDMLLTAIQAIESIDDLRPSPHVNALFTQLVSEIVAGPDVRLDLRTQQNMRRIASIAETEMELYWAKKIIASAAPSKTLGAFPYLNNYRELVRREILLVEKSGYTLNERSRVLMVGTGPLPLTGLELVAQRNVDVDHVDISISALAMCSLVSNRLGLTCGHVLGDGATAILTKTYDLVIIAALAGITTEQKQAIINNILPSLTDDGRILLRSAHGMRTLLYPDVLANAFDRVKLLEEYHPSDDIINSVLVYKKDES